MNTWTIFKRELTSYFTQLTAYAVIVIFGLLSIGLAFTFGSFWRYEDASLSYSFFWWHPLLLMILAPAVTMRLWSDEQASDTTRRQIHPVQHLKLLQPQPLNYVDFHKAPQLDRINSI